MNFNTFINRKNTNSVKYDFASKYKKPQDILPLWVADMDFQAPPEVLQALEQKVHHGIFGYSDTTESYFRAVQNWFSLRHHWTPEENWLMKTPGIVFAIAAAVRALTQEGDSILIQTPVYYPFYRIIEENNRHLVKNPLVKKGNSYFMDFEDLEKKIKENQVKMAILCSPHNPVGRVWTKEELVSFGELCERYGVLVVSDEIHADFTFPGFCHTIFPSVKQSFEQFCVLCTSPSKTFNLAGLQASNIFIPNLEYRKKMKKEMKKIGYEELNIMAITACQAAYEYGAPWLDSLKKYLKQNLDYVRNFLKTNLPQIQLIEPQGTYLLWLDFNALQLSSDALEHLIIHQAGLWLDSGTMFGTEGQGFQRINIACPRSILEKAMYQLKQAIDSLT